MAVRLGNSTITARLIPAVVMAAGLAMGLAPAAHADVNTEVCLAVMALNINPYDPNDGYALGMVQRYPDMTYNQALNLAKKAYSSVHWHQNPMCNGVTIPPDY